MKQKKNSSLRQVVLRPEVVLDKAVYEDTWLPVGDNKDMDLRHLIEQGRIDEY